MNEGAVRSLVGLNIERKSCLPCVPHCGNDVQCGPGLPVDPVEIVPGRDMTPEECAAYRHFQDTGDVSLLVALQKGL